MADTALEVVVPSLMQGEPGTEGAREAKLDVHVWVAPPQPCDVYLDVTVRHPWSMRCRGQAASAPGRGSPGGAREGGALQFRGGVHVVAAAVEPWGRMGHGTNWFYQMFATRWALVRRAAPDETAQVPKRWIAKLGVAMARARYCTLCEALGCRTGRR